METGLNKKLILILLKYSPWIIGVSYLLQCILVCFGIQSFILTSIFSISIFPIILLCLFSYFLGFCIWNRMPLYYATSCNIINIIDYYVEIPISNMWMLICYLILLGIFVTIGAYVKNKRNVRKRNPKESST